MLDYRLLTFIDVCESRSFTTTAQNLCMTQPAITQHIKYLEQKFQTKLIRYEGKKMQITEAGDVILKFARKTQALSKEKEADLEKIKTKQIKLNFGATLTIADFVMPCIIKEYAKTNPESRINFIADNTKHLIEKLKSGHIAFAFIEGYFDKDEFEHHLLKTDQFILVTSPDHPLTKKESLELEDVASSRVIVREKGSGSRDILEKLLANKNASLNLFDYVMEIGNVTIIKELVKENLGVTFIYKDAIREELASGVLKEVVLNDVYLEREFNFVFLKSSLNKPQYLDFLNFARGVIK
ncbi:MAG: LysR family transcriptional regulator [Turicibacter sp.]